jgi:hypothetical protein
LKRSAHSKGRMITNLISGTTVVGGSHVVNWSNMERWSGVIFESKARNKKNIYPNLTVIPDSSEINQSLKHATRRGKDSKHATSKNQQVESIR